MIVSSINKKIPSISFKASQPLKPLHANQESSTQPIKDVNAQPLRPVSKNDKIGNKIDYYA